MAVGPIQTGYVSIRGHLMVTLCDAAGNIKAISEQHNVIGSMAKKQLASMAFNGGAGISAKYIFLGSGFPGAATPTLSMANAGSDYANWSVAPVQTPVTCAWNWDNETQWSVAGTMTFSGVASIISANAAALCYGANATTSAGAVGDLASWFAVATFADMAIQSLDKVTFQWAFSLV